MKYKDSVAYLARKVGRYKVTGETNISALKKESRAHKI